MYFFFIIMLNLVLLGMNQNKLSGTDLISIQIIRRVENEKKNPEECIFDWGVGLKQLPGI